MTHRRTDSASHASKRSSPGVFEGVRQLAKRARGDVQLTHELAALRREFNSSLVEVRRELEDVRLVGEATLRGIAKQRGPYGLARPAIRRRFEPPRPWMAEGAVEHVSALLDTSMRGVEWGGGASTPYWCERLGILHTFEADRGFALLLIDFMTRKTSLADRWRLHFVPCNWANAAAAERKKGIPLPPDDVKQALTQDYAGLLPDPVDAIFVDGAVREATLEATGRYIERDRPRVIVIDNTDADYVRLALEALDTSAYTRHDYTGAEPGMTVERWMTSVFVRR